MGLFGPVCARGESSPALSMPLAAAWCWRGALSHPQCRAGMGVSDWRGAPGEPGGQKGITRKAQELPGLTPSGCVTCQCFGRALANRLTPKAPVLCLSPPASIRDAKTTVSVRLGCGTATPSRGTQGLCSPFWCRMPLKGRLTFSLKFKNCV